MSTINSGVKTFSRIFSLSFSGKKIAIQVLGILCACVATLIISGLGKLILQERLHLLVSIINWVAVIIIMFLTWGAIAKVTIAEIAGLPPVNFKAALRAAKARARALIIAPTKIVCIIITMMIIHLVAGLIGLIPLIGEIIWPFFAIPLFILSAFIFVSILILLCGTLLLPHIIMLDRKSPVSELNDFLRAHTLRFIGGLVATVAVLLIIVWFLNGVTATNTWLTTSVMGDKYAAIVASSPTKIPDAMEMAGSFLNAPFALIRISPATFAERLLAAERGLSSIDLRWSYTFAGFIWGLFTFIIYLVLVALPAVIWCVSGTLIYLGLKPEAIPPQS